MSKEMVDQLVLLSLQKKNMLEKFLGRTQDQVSLIKEDRTQELAELLREKDSLIGSIDQVDIAYLKAYEDLKALEKIQSLDQIDISKYENIRRLKDTTVEIYDLLREIDLLDRENIKLIRERVGDVKSDLRTVKTVQTAYKGYSNNSGGPGSSMMIDERK